MSANYLDIRLLIKISGKIIANMITDKTPDQIRRTFYIEDDLTAEIKCGEEMYTMNIVDWKLLKINNNKVLKSGPRRIRRSFL